MPFLVICMLGSFMYIGKAQWPLQKFPVLINLAQYKYVIAYSLLLLFSLVLFSYYGSVNEQNTFGQLGYSQDYRKAAAFLLRNNIPGPIFNNFDNGGYLDYRIYPQYQTFVDNRPDAFPGDFFRQVYIPMQQDPAVWKSVEKKYHIQTIVFSYTDQTPWANAFTSSILLHPEWKLVYLDGTTFILTKADGYEDLRARSDKLTKIVKAETDYRKLAYLARLFSQIDKPDLSSVAFEKAKNSNPDSCLINRFLVSNYLNRSTSYYDALADRIKSNYWFCF